MALLSDDDIAQGLPAGWQHDGDTIRKEFTFDAFLDGIGFVTRLADAAEEADHHPDIDIRYTRVTVALSTHSEGGVTDKDLALAQRAETLANA